MATMEAIVTGHSDGWAFASATSGIVNTVTAVTLKAAVAAPTCNYVASLQIAHDALGGVTELTIRDGAAVLWRHKLQTVTGGVYINCQGFTAP